MLTDVIQNLYRYNTWANARILDTAATVEPARLRDPGGASFDSVHDTLVHTLAAQWLYLERWQGRSPRTLPRPAEFAGLAAIRTRWEEIERDTRTFLSLLTDARLAERVAYTNLEGTRWTYPLWQQMLHQVNHATQHRSEAAMLLTRLGHSPGLLDYLDFLDVGGPDMAPDTP